VHLTLIWTLPARPGSRQTRYKLPRNSDLDFRAIVGVQLTCAPQAFGPDPALEQGEPDSLPGQGADSAPDAHLQAA
jgi:hypothetical protein